MMTRRVNSLLEQAIDVPLKLHCVMLFTQRVLSRPTSEQIGQRLSCDHWTLQETLDSLVEAGVLQVSQVKDSTIYTCAPGADLADALAQLTELYADPLARVELYERINDLARYAPYRADFARFDTYAH